MPYELIYTRRAAKDIDKLEQKVKERIKGGLEKYKGEPFQFATKLAATEIGTYRFRIGDYRVVFDMEDDKIIVLRVGHRREIYRGI